MDPSVEIAKLSRKKVIMVKPVGYTHNPDSKEVKISDLELVDQILVTNFLSSKKESGLGKEQIEILHRKVDPFADLGSSVFFSPKSVELANIDSIFNITHSKKGNLSSFPPLGVSQYLYVAIEDNKGVIAQYLQYRKMLTIGYGLGFKPGEKSLDFDLDKSIERRDINMYQLERGETDDVYTNVKRVTKKLRSYHTNGFMLVVSLGKEIEDENFDIAKREINNNNLLLNELLASILLLGEGGNLVSVGFGVTEIDTLNLLYIVSTCFKTFHIIKPISSDSTDVECWIVGLSLIPDIREQIKMLTKMSELYEERLLLPVVKLDFVNYIRSVNLHLYTRAITYMKKIKKSRGRTRERTQYNTSRLFLAWDIPSYSKDW